MLKKNATGLHRFGRDYLLHFLQARTPGRLKIITILITCLSTKDIPVRIVIIPKARKGGGILDL